MNVDIDGLLRIVGCLDDARGYDTPRERFRRFMSDSVTDASIATDLIVQCQKGIGEQRHRALQDLVVWLGRFLGFEPIWGAYAVTGSRGTGRGLWRSREVDVVVETRTEQSTGIALDGICSAVSGSSSTEAPRRIGVCVVSRHYLAWERLKQSVSAGSPDPVLAVVRIEQLIDVVSKARERHLATSQVADELIRSSVRRDEASGDPEAAIVKSDVSRSADGPSAPKFWLATLVGDESVAPDRLLASVVSRRHLLPLLGPPHGSECAPGDFVCFSLGSNDVVGHGRVESIVAEPTALVRKGFRYRRVVRLTDVQLYDLHPEGGGDVAAGRAARSSLAGAYASSIQSSDFAKLTHTVSAAAPAASG